MTFEEVLPYIKSGSLAARSGWNGKGMYVFLVNGSKFTVNREPLVSMFPEGTEIEYTPHIDMKYADGRIGPWLASQLDIMADDWMLVPNAT